LENQPDFLNEKSQLEIEIVNRIFYSKFHCELNSIGYFWAAVKRYTRENCNYSFAELDVEVFRCLVFWQGRNTEQTAQGGGGVIFR
jgi:transposase